MSAAIACLAPGCDWPLEDAWPPACPKHWWQLPVDLRAALRRNAPAPGAPEGVGYVASRFAAVMFLKRLMEREAAAAARPAPYWARD